MKNIGLILLLLVNAHLFAQSSIKIGKKKVSVNEIISIKPDTMVYTTLNENKKVDTNYVETSSVSSIVVDKVEIDMNFINSYYREIDELGLFDQGVKDAKKRYKTNFGAKFLSFVSSYYVPFPILGDYVGAGIVLANYNYHVPNQRKFNLPKEYPRSQYYMKGYENQVAKRRRSTAWLSFHSGWFVKYASITSFFIILSQ